MYSKTSARRSRRRSSKPEDAEIVCKGVLGKMNRRGQWQRRFFVLIADVLQYYDEKDADEMKYMKDQMSLQNLEIIEVEDVKESRSCHVELRFAKAESRPSVRLQLTEYQKTIWLPEFRKFCKVRKLRKKQREATKQEDEQIARKKSTASDEQRVRKKSSARRNSMFSFSRSGTNAEQGDNHSDSNNRPEPVQRGRKMSDRGAGMDATAKTNKRLSVVVLDQHGQRVRIEDSVDLSDGPDTGHGAFEGSLINSKSDSPAPGRRRSMLSFGRKKQNSASGKHEQSSAGDRSRTGDKEKSKERNGDTHIEKEMRREGYHAHGRNDRFSGEPSSSELDARSKRAHSVRSASGDRDNHRRSHSHSQRESRSRKTSRSDNRPSTPPEEPISKLQLPVSPSQADIRLVVLMTKIRLQQRSKCKAIAFRLWLNRLREKQRPRSISPLLVHTAGNSWSKPCMVKTKHDA